MTMIDWNGISWYRV